MYTVTIACRGVALQVVNTRQTKARAIWTSKASRSQEMDLYRSFDFSVEVSYCIEGWSPRRGSEADCAYTADSSQYLISRRFA